MELGTPAVLDHFSCFWRLWRIKVYHIEKEKNCLWQEYQGCFPIFSKPTMKPRPHMHCGLDKGQLWGYWGRKLFRNATGHSCYPEQKITPPQIDLPRKSSPVVLSPWYSLLPRTCAYWYIFALLRAMRRRMSQSVSRSDSAGLCSTEPEQLARCDMSINLRSSNGTGFAACWYFSCDNCAPARPHCYVFCSRSHHKSEHPSK